MNWSNLKKNKCPQCSKDFVRSGTYENGKVMCACGFQIGEKKMKMIVGDRIKKKERLPAIPPNDYEGTIADWTTALVSRGIMTEDDFYGDFWLDPEEYDEILTECEK